MHYLAVGWIKLLSVAISYPDGKGMSNVYTTRAAGQRMLFMCFS